MFGIAEHIHTETSGISAMYYLRNVARLPDLVIANLDKGGKNISAFILEFERFLKRKNKNSTIVLLYNKEKKEFNNLKQYRHLKKPLCIPELCDEQKWLEEY